MSLIFYVVNGHKPPWEAHARRGVRTWRKSKWGQCGHAPDARQESCSCTITWSRLRAEELVPQEELAALVLSYATEQEVGTAVEMPIQMTGSLNPRAYPGPSAEKWAERARQDVKEEERRGQGYSDLQTKKLSKAQKERDARKAKRKADEAKYKARQQALRDKQNKEKGERGQHRATSLAKIECALAAANIPQPCLACALHDSAVRLQSVCSTAAAPGMRSRDLTMSDCRPQSQPHGLGARGEGHGGCKTRAGRRATCCRAVCSEAGDDGEPRWRVPCRVGMHVVVW